jgi:serine protease
MLAGVDSLSALSSYMQSKQFKQVCLAAILAAVSLGAAASNQAQATADGLLTDQLIVKYKDAKGPHKGVAARLVSVSATRQMVLDRAGQQFGLKLKALRGLASGAHVFKLDRRMAARDVAALAAELEARDPEVEYAEPDSVMQPLYIPNDPRFMEQWHYHESKAGLGLVAAWDIANGAGVNVAVIDTGVRPHADLAGQILPGYDFIANSAMANDGGGRDSDASDPGDAVVAGECGSGQPSADQGSSWHGTHVAGTIGALTGNGLGVAGVAFRSKILPVRVLGKCGGYTSDIADGITWASGGTVSGAPVNPNKARVLNLSLGGTGSCSITTQNAINGARSRGAVVVVAAGNANVDAANTNPANCAGVITVAAVNRAGGKAYYSNYGNVVDVAAPGGDARVAGSGVLSTLNTGTKAPLADSYAFYQGTSMATPHVAGAAALMLSKNPALTPDEVEARLKSTARPFPAACGGCGTGMVTASAALGATTAPVPTANEAEANNTMATANPLTTSGVQVNGTMASGTDTDFFVVQVPAGRTFSATLIPGWSNTDYDLYAYNSSGSLIARSENEAGLNDAVSITNTGTVTAPVYVRVTYYGGPVGTSGKYQLKASW